MLFDLDLIRSVYQRMPERISKATEKLLTDLGVHVRAKAKVTEEFINYDFLAGRTRTYLDTMGLTWFYHFKIRAVKIAMATLRNNPLHFLLSGMIPGMGDVGTPVGDNLVTMGIENKLGYSMGPGMAFTAHASLPIANVW